MIEIYTSVAELHIWRQIWIQILRQLFSLLVVELYSHNKTPRCQYIQQLIFPFSSRDFCSCSTEAEQL